MSFVCHFCGQLGHWKKEWPTGILCFRCLRPGHIAKVCGLRLQNRGRLGALGGIPRGSWQVAHLSAQVVGGRSGRSDRHYGPAGQPPQGEWSWDWRREEVFASSWRWSTLRRIPRQERCRASGGPRPLLLEGWKNLRVVPSSLPWERWWGRWLWIHWCRGMGRCRWCFLRF